MATTPVSTVRTFRPLTDMQFCTWVAQALPGMRLEYHQGFLGIDVSADCGGLSCEQRRELSRLATRTLWAADHGLVHLAQSRIGNGRFSYLAIARPKRRGARFSLSELLSDAST